MRVIGWSAARAGWRPIWPWARPGSRRSLWMPMRSSASCAASSRISPGASSALWNYCRISRRCVTGDIRITRLPTRPGCPLPMSMKSASLIANGEERLLIAVETGQMPLSVALYITRAEEKDVQKALEAAYASGELRGKKLLEARRLVELRKRHGKHKGVTRSTGSRTRMTSAALVNAYRAEAERQKDMINRSQVTRSGLLFLDAAFKSLLKDENFLTLLRAEGLDSLPRIVVDGLGGATT
ncbi:plasmid partitioning protein RepB C-terminal domain-containing protein [Paracoccus homiensis]|uniref:plasmid partitioning protein RepB C-terminal domain-containing protein n=1 Tax=Paracoccus homiensis TaxID=364199 RepID=UPI00398CC630